VSRWIFWYKRFENLPKIKEPTPKIGQKKSPAFTNTWRTECSGAGGSGHGSGRGVAGRSKRQRQNVTLWSGCPASADSLPEGAGANCLQPPRSGHQYAPVPSLAHEHKHMIEGCIFRIGVISFRLGCGGGNILCWPQGDL